LVGLRFRVEEGGVEEEPAVWKSEFAYDGWMRRRARVESIWKSGAWVTNEVVRYVYDGNLVIQERDANNIPIVSFTRGRDLSGSRQGAGGIGGLLARTDHHLLMIGDPRANAYFHADAGGNVTALINTNQLIEARYLYDPFGNVISQSGPLAEENLYRFSSKEQHANSALVYYGYRYYEPNLQRWINRDPMEEDYDINLYRDLYNASLNYVDPDGLWGIKIGDFNIGQGNPNLAFDSDSWNDIGQAAQATLDGIIPFGDPFMNNGGYDPCDPVLGWSRALGRAARDIYLLKAALKGQELRFSKNFRIAPFGNRTGHRFGELPHYHRRYPGPGGGIGRHRPWEGW
jgi:RHS repeat-associated protein